MLCNTILLLCTLLSLLPQSLALQLVPLASEHFVEESQLAKRLTNSSGPNNSNLDLLDYESFYWGGDGGDSLVFANLTLFFKKEYEFIVSMERFDGMLTAVDCHADSMMLEFKNNDTFTYAKNTWNWVSDAVNNTFVMIANYDGCGPDQERQPFLVNDLRFDPGSFKVFLEAQQKEWEDVAKTYTFNMGYKPPLNSSVLAKRGGPDFAMSLASNFNKNLFSTEIDGIDLSVDCVNCGTTGHLKVDFDMDFNLFSDSHLKMKISPHDVAAVLELALSAEGNLTEEYKWEKTVISIPIEGVKVAKFAKIGAFLEVDVGFTMDEWAGDANARFGARMGLSNKAVVEIDALHPGKGKFSGWKPALTPIPFTMSANVGGGVTLYAQPVISLSAEAFGKGVELSLDLKMPYIEADFTAMADTSGVCETQQTLGVDVNAEAGVDLSVQVAKAGDEENPVWEQQLLQKSWPLFNKCFAFGPKNAQSGAPPMPKPPRKSKTKAKHSKTKSPPKKVPTTGPAMILKPKPTKNKSRASGPTKPSKTKTHSGASVPKSKPTSSNSNLELSKIHTGSSEAVVAKSSRKTESSIASKSGAKPSTTDTETKRSKTSGATSTSLTLGTKPNINKSFSKKSSISTNAEVDGSSASHSKATKASTNIKSRTTSSKATNSKPTKETDSNANASKRPSSKTISSPSSSSAAAPACKLNARANDNDFYCDENGHTHTTTTTSTISSLTTPKVTCSSGWTQACYHYRSVMSVHTKNTSMVQFTCGETTSSSAPGKATKVWSTTINRNNVVITPKGNQHHWQWIEGWVPPGDNGCQRDEWPPRYFWPASKRNKLGQLVRFIPGGENGGAGSMFRSFCEKNGEKNSKLHTTVASSESVNVQGGATTTITSVKVEVPKPVFKITDWDGLPEDPADSDGLKKNPCWPSMLVPDDPGFALLTDDPYYQHNTKASATVKDYAKPPSPAITSGKTPRWPVSMPASQSSADDSMDDLDATDTPILTARGLEVAWRMENGTLIEELVNSKEKREMVKRGMWVEEVVAGPAETEAIPTPVIEFKDPVTTWKTVARTKISADLPETTGI